MSKIYKKAQAAGDKLRARMTPSRRKRDNAVSFDQAGYQNRWASYSDPASFHHRNLGGSSQITNEPKLSSESKRQVCHIDDTRNSLLYMNHSRAGIYTDYCRSLNLQGKNFDAGQIRFGT